MAINSLDVGKSTKTLKLWHLDVWNALAKDKTNKNSLNNIFFHKGNREMSNISRNNTQNIKVCLYQNKSIEVVYKILI